ncbi:MAG: hypothetical protein ABR964_11190 [Tepidisphaeraceae bacterium]|jgi:hypothetical protein
MPAKFNIAKTSLMARLALAIYVSAIVLLMTFTGGCGVAYTRITQTYEDRQIMSKAQAIENIKGYTFASVSADENGFGYQIYVKDAEWNADYRPSGHYTHYTRYHYDERHIAFGDVREIHLHWVDLFGASDTGADVTLVDQHGASLFQFYFRGGSLDPKTRRAVQQMLSSLLTLCPNVQ